MRLRSLTVVLLSVGGSLWLAGCGAKASRPLAHVLDCYYVHSGVGAPVWMRHPEFRVVFDVATNRVRVLSSDASIDMQREGEGPDLRLVVHVTDDFTQELRVTNTGSAVMINTGRGGKIVKSQNALCKNGDA